MYVHGACCALSTFLITLLQQIIISVRVHTSTRAATTIHQQQLLLSTAPAVHVQLAFQRAELHCEAHGGALVASRAASLSSCKHCLHNRLLTVVLYHVHSSARGCASVLRTTRIRSTLPLKHHASHSAQDCVVLVAAPLLCRSVTTALWHSTALSTVPSYLRGHAFSPEWTPLSCTV
jgi:hypothetical protein